jgi:hypothetical protein
VPRRTVQPVRRKPKAKAKASRRQSLSSGIRSLVLSDTARVRGEAKRRVEKLQAELDALLKRREQFHEVDVPSHRIFFCTYLGPQRAQLTELADKLSAAEALLSYVQLVAFQLMISPVEAYGRVMDERNGKGPAIPPSPQLDPAQAGDESEDAPDDFKDLFDSLFDEDDEDDFYRPFGEDFDGRVGKPSKDATHEGQEIARIYRLIVKQLHPDRIGAMTEAQRAIWQTAQDAYQCGNLAILHSCLERCGYSGPLLQLEVSVASMLQKQREIQRAQIAVRQELRELSSHPAWNFSSLGSHEKKLSRVTRELSREIAQLRRRHLEMEAMIDELKSEYEYELEIREIQARRAEREVNFRKHGGGRRKRRGVGSNEAEPF